MSVVLVDVELLVGIVGIEMVAIGDVMPMMVRRGARPVNLLLHSVVDLGGDVVLLLLLRKWMLRI